MPRLHRVTREGVTTLRYGELLLCLWPSPDVLIVSGGGWQCAAVLGHINRELPPALSLGVTRGVGWTWPRGEAFAPGHYVSLTKLRYYTDEHPYFTRLLDGHPGLGRKAMLPLV